MTTFRPRARLLALVALLAVLSGALLYFSRRPPRGERVYRPGILQANIDEPSFQPTATAGDLLQLAERTASEVIREYPEDPGAYSVQARRHYLLSETEEARALWRQCLNLDPQFGEAFFGLGLVALDCDEYEEAARRFEDAARIDEKDPRLPVLLAKSWLLGGRIEDAILTLEQHVATEQTSAEAWEMLGQAHLQSQQFQRAAECFDVAVRAVPNMKDAVYGLARAHARLGHARQAEAYAEQFRQLAEAMHVENTESAKAFRDRNFAAHVAAQTHADSARVYQRNGQLRRGEQLLLRAVLLEPDNSQFLVLLQRSLQQRGSHPEAAEVGERIVELEPSKPEHWLNLGWLYSHLDHPDRAIAACKKAIELNPDDPRCRQAYEIIRQAE